jgi:predicted DNA-binding transcriptional regulator AlpA
MFENTSCRRLPDGPVKICSYDYLAKHGITASRSTLDRWEKKGIFPQRVRCSPSIIGWVQSEIDDYLLNLASARKAGR